jgi:hypothetical protein
MLRQRQLCQPANVIVMTEGRDAVIVLVACSTSTTTPHEEVTQVGLTAQALEGW